MKKSLMAFALLSLAACSGNSDFNRYNNPFGTGTFPVANDGQAALYLVRDVSSPDAPPINITLNDAPVGGLPPSSYMRLNLDPRLYDFRAYGSQANNELIVTVAPGQTRFLLAQPTPSGSAELLELSQEQGRRLVRKGQAIEPMAY
ncbi:MAG: hypothetical protein FJX11_08955 [Alphaproteobacteria bacterium]|nr:hypothetical protein [Alphaproteobacteria bacterium]